MPALNWTQLRRNIRILAGIAVSALQVVPVHADIDFVEVTADVGITYVGQSWGAAWGDFNNDGLPDLWMSNHKAPESLYINQGGGFVDIAADVVPPAAFDTHGAAWADFDNDGDQDLIQFADGGSGTEGNSLLVNQGLVTFSDESLARGVLFPESRGRTPLWLDYNNDGMLDLLVTASVRDSDLQPFNVLFKQNDQGTFTAVNEIVGLDSSKSIHFAAVSDVTQDGQMEILTRSVDFPEKTYELSSLPFGTLAVVPTITNAVDVAIGDFNGDLIQDFYAVRGTLTNEILQVGDSLVEVHLDTGPGTEMGFDIVSDGDVTMTLLPTWQFYLGNIPVYVGNPAVELFPPFVSISLSSTDPANWNLPPHAAGEDVGIFIGFDPDNDTWSMRLSAVVAPLNFEIHTTEAIENLQAVGFNANATPRRDVFLGSTGQGHVDMSLIAGISTPSWGRAVAAADFDNDMDLDIYILATGQTRNRDNILYENDGSGVFVAVPGAGGALGHPQGHGDAIALADYDVDGYMDILMTNGKSHEPWDEDGPVQLYRNVPGDNHWLELDLRGTESNRDGVGATVYATAGGVTQMREQNGGIHHRAQNHQRIHFGLADNAIVEHLEVRWPSGRLQSFDNIAADQVLTIVEPLPDNCGQSAPAKPGGEPPVQVLPDLGVTLTECLSGPRPIGIIPSLQPTRNRSIFPIRRKHN